MKGTSAGQEKIVLSFFGHEYFLSTRDEEVDVREVVRYVEDKVNESADLYGNMPAHRQILLTVLTIAKDYIMARDRLASMGEHLERMVQQVDRMEKADREEMSQDAADPQAS